MQTGFSNPSMTTRYRILTSKCPDRRDPGRLARLKRDRPGPGSDEPLHNHSKEVSLDFNDYVSIGQPSSNINTLNRQCVGGRHLGPRCRALPTASVQITSRQNHCGNNGWQSACPYISRRADKSHIVFCPLLPASPGEP